MLQILAEAVQIAQRVPTGKSGCAGINDVSAAFIDSQYSQVFTPDDCALREFDAENFNTQMAGRRLLFLGDSLMRGNWGSLACLLRDQVRACNSPRISDAAFSTGSLTTMNKPRSRIDVRRC